MFQIPPDPFLFLSHCLRDVLTPFLHHMFQRSHELSSSHCFRDSFTPFLHLIFQRCFDPLWSISCLRYLPLLFRPIVSEMPWSPFSISCFRDPLTPFLHLIFQRSRDSLSPFHIYFRDALTFFPHPLAPDRSRQARPATFCLFTVLWYAKHLSLSIGSAQSPCVKLPAINLAGKRYLPVAMMDCETVGRGTGGEKENGGITS